ncbi:MAG TPA: amidohydrolase family protein [Verrucomicrobiae bacterium]
MPAQTKISRRQFIVTSAATVAGPVLLNSCATQPAPEPIIDIHQHCNYGGKRDAQWRQIGPARSDEELIAHQQNMGVSQTILLPSGTPVIRASTHEGRSNGLESTCAGVDGCAALARRLPRQFYFASNEVPDLEGAPQIIEKYLKAGAVCVAEQKFGVECDGPEMQIIYKLVAAYQVPILMHWQFQSYNYGYERFYKMLEKHSRTIFVCHAQTAWAHIDKNYVDDTANLYPHGKVTPGGWTDRYLSDYPNFFADLSADSGYNALTRDREFTRVFFQRHQDKLMFGSDCSDKIGHGNDCTGWKTIQTVRELAGSKEIERKLLYHNAKRMYRL